jgi:acyl transferase domain-containing protein
MGRPLYEAGGVFANSMNEMDRMVQARTGRSVLAELYGGASKLTPMLDLDLAHPAIVMVELSLANHLSSSGIRPHMTLGASLGAYAAAVVSGLLETEEALTLVIRNARAIVECCPEGGMLAVIGNASGEWFSMLDGENLELAGRSFPGHFVVSGPSEALTVAEAILKSKGAVYQRLPTRYAFHSKWIEAARSRILSELGKVQYRRARVPMVCCREARPVSGIDDQYFWQVTRSPIDFQAAVAHVESMGAYRYIDVGPSGTLATFMKYALKPASRSKAVPVMTAYGHDVKHLAQLLFEAGAH